MGTVRRRVAPRRGDVVSDTQQFEGEMNRSLGETDETAQATTQAHLEVLQAENRRLRREAVHAHQASHRRTALGLTAIGIVGVGSAALFPSLQTVLLVLGAIGLFGAVLTYYLTPERFVAAAVGDRIAAAMDESLQRLETQLGLTDQRIIVPTSAPDTATLYVPVEEVQDLSEAALPAVEALDSPFVTNSEGALGLAIIPSGVKLYSVFSDQGASGTASTIPERLETLGEALSEQFELVDSVEIDSTTQGEATLRLIEPVYADGSWFEDPLASFLGVGLITHLNKPVSVTVRTDDPDRIIQYRWESTESPD